MDMYLAYFDWSWSGIGKDINKMKPCPFVVCGMIMLQLIIMYKTLMVDSEVAQVYIMVDSEVAQVYILIENYLLHQTDAHWYPHV